MRVAFSSVMIKELSDAEIDQFLRSEVFGRLGCHARGRTYVVPMTYVYDGTSVVGCTGDGLKVRMMRENPRVCFEVDRVGNDNVWQSAVVQGHFRELRGDEARVAMERFVAGLEAAEVWRGQVPMYGAGRLVPWRESTSARLEVVFAIDVVEKSGRSGIPDLRMHA